MDLRDLYEETILDHNRSPRNFGHRPQDSNRTAAGYNPLCGDEVHIVLRVRDGVVEDIGFEGHGCAISTASASLMSEAVKGMTEAQAHALFDEVRQMLIGDQGSVPDDIGKLEVLAGIREFPMRVKCATLAWHTLHAALSEASDPVTTE